MKKFFLTFVAAIFLLIGQIAPVFASQNITLTFSTDKKEYSPGNTIVVSGMVLKGQEAGKGTNPTLQMRNSSGDVKQVEKWDDSEIAANGSFSKNIKLSKTIETGIYTIIISASGVQQSTEIVISDAITPKLSLTIETDKIKYKVGDTVLISGKVKRDEQPIEGSKVTLTIGNGEILKNFVATSNSNGEYSATFETKDPNVTAGTYTVTATAAEAKPAVTTFEVYVDNTTPGPNPDPKPNPDPNPKPDPDPDPKPDPKPDPSQDKTPPAAPKVNEIKDYDKKITGKTEANAMVIVKSGKLIIGKAAADQNGKFTISLKHVQKAGTVLYITATDKAGNVSRATKVTVKDKTAPKAPTVSKVYSTSTKVTGKAEANSKIIILYKNKSFGTATTNKKGQYSVTIKKQKPGVILYVIATDKAGNKSKATKVTVIDKTPPSVPTVNTIKSSTVKVTGKAEPGAKVYVKVGKKIIGSATVAKKGNYSIKIKKQKKGTVLYVYAKDKAGNIGKAKKVTVR